MSRRQGAQQPVRRADAQEAREGAGDRFDKAAQTFNDVIDAVEARCMAAEGCVTPTLDEMREEELRRLWKAVQTIRAALARSREQGEPAAWQPIETAPKDGTQVLGMSERVYAPVVTYYHSGAERWAIGSAVLLNQPTRWMPLPEPPQRPKEG